MTTFTDVADLQSAVGTLLGPTDWVTVTQARIDGFADATDDHQWIHVDPVRAADGPFGGTIAHGYLTLALVGRFTTEILDLAFTDSVINYGVNRVRFPSPAPVGSLLRARVRLDALDTTPRGAQLTITTTVEREGDDRPVCIAETLLLLPGVVL